MELFDLDHGLKAVGSGGYVLNCQELTGVQAGLTLLKSKEKLADIYFWGKIFGQKSDYYVAYGLKDTGFEFPSKQFYCAGEDFDFMALPRLTEDVGELIAEMDTEKPFTGDPKASLKEGGAGGEGEEGQEGEEAQAEAGGDPSKSLTEADRLAWVVQEIDFDTAVAPKGAHALNEAHVVVRSGDFRGLGMTEATGLGKYVHFRSPSSVASLRALARSDATFYADFLDSLEADLPKGCWAVRQDPSAALVTLRSLNWPGYIAFHVPGTTKYGGVYFGYAQKCRDLPFLL
jgi:radial spoke head protein 9